MSFIHFQANWLKSAANLTDSFMPIIKNFRDTIKIRANVKKHQKSIDQVVWSIYDDSENALLEISKQLDEHEKVNESISLFETASVHNESSSSNSTEKSSTDHVNSSANIQNQQQKEEEEEEEESEVEKDVEEEEVEKEKEEEGNETTKTEQLESKSINKKQSKWIEKLEKWKNHEK